MRVRVKDCTAVPEFAAVIFTVEVPAGVTGALGAVGTLVGFEEPPPPHPASVNIATDKVKASNTYKRSEEILPFLRARAIDSNPGAQNAAAGSRGLFPGTKGAPRRSSAVLPAVCMVTTVV